MEALKSAFRYCRRRNEVAYRGFRDGLHRRLDTRFGIEGVRHW